MSRTFARRLALWFLGVSIATPALAQSGGISIPDSMFQPIRLPETGAFGYPPNETYLPRFIELIRKRQFDSLDTIYDGLEADVQRDVRNERRFDDAFDATDRNEPALLTALDAWVAAKPRSAHARVARARYHYAAAWRRRGNAYIKDTPPERLKAMAESAEAAMRDVVAGLILDSTHLVAHEIGIGVFRLASAHDRAFQLMVHGVTVHPGSYVLPAAFASMLWPRWGGSEEVLKEFGERAAGDSAKNPRLATLRGVVYENRANDSSLARNYAGAVRELNKALAFGPETRYLRARGIAYYRLQAYEYAFHDLRTAMIERSQDREVLDYYGSTLVELASRARPGIRPTILSRASEVLRLAVYLDPLNDHARAALDRATSMSGQ